MSDNKPYAVTFPDGGVTVYPDKDTAEGVIHDAVSADSYLGYADFEIEPIHAAETKYIALANGRGSLPLSEKGYATAVAMGEQQLQLHLQVAATLEATGWVASIPNIKMVAGSLPAIRSWAALL